jgi:hypothetical protein
MNYAELDFEGQEAGLWKGWRVGGAGRLWILICLSVIGG